MASNPPRSRRAKILNNLMRQLRTITVANGYATTVVEVSQNVKNWSDKPEAETPVLYVIDDTARPQYHAGKLVEWEWDVAVIGYMKNKQQEDMEEFISDIIDCLFENVTLAFSDTGRVISHMRVGGISTDNQLYSEIEGSQLFRIDLTLRYTACVDDTR